MLSLLDNRKFMDFPKSPRLLRWHSTCQWEIKCKEVLALTNNQIQYQKLLEEKRSNLANEGLERTKQIETGRHNLATEIETNRTNLQNEGLKREGNIITEQHYQRSDTLGLSQLSEQIRNNKANLAELNRSNIAREAETNRSNLAREAETSRANRTAEDIKREANEITKWKGAFPGSTVVKEFIDTIGGTGDSQLSRSIGEHLRKSQAQDPDVWNNMWRHDQ